MRESEKLRVQTETAERIGDGAVKLVTHHRMTRLGKMRANLIFSPGLQRDFEHRVRRRDGDCTVVRHSELCVGMRIDAAHAQIAAFEQIRSNRSEGRLNPPFYS